MTTERKRIRLCVCLIFANLALIWGNSLISGADSGAMSGGVTAFLMELLGIPQTHEGLFHTLIRKAAHFTEFACLGVLLCWRFGMAGQQGIHLWSMPLLCGMLSAMVDETIQMFTPDRGPSVMDVWIDTSGVLAGISLLLAGYHLKKRIKLTDNYLEETT